MIIFRRFVDRRSNGVALDVDQLPRPGERRRSPQAARTHAHGARVAARTHLRARAAEDAAAAPAGTRLYYTSPAIVYTNNT